MVSVIPLAGFPAGEPVRREAEEGSIVSPPLLTQSSGRRIRITTLLAVVVVLAWSFGGDFLPPQGPVLLHVDAPVDGAVIGPDGLEVLVRFATRDRAAAETFRALLNGAEVTEDLTTAQNGAWGRLHGLLDGENVLRLEIFGRSWTGSDRLVEHVREVRVRMRRPLGLNRG